MKRFNWVPYYYSKNSFLEEDKVDYQQNEHSGLWSMTVYGTETWTSEYMEANYQENIEMWTSEYMK